MSNLLNPHRHAAGGLVEKGAYDFTGDPGPTDSSGGAEYQGAWEAQFDDTYEIVGIAFYAMRGGQTGTATAMLFSSGNSLLADGELDISTVSGEGWVFIEFDTSYTVATSTVYRSCIHWDTDIDYVPYDDGMTGNFSNDGVTIYDNSSSGISGTATPVTSPGWDYTGYGERHWHTPYYLG